MTAGRPATRAVAALRRRVQGTVRVTGEPGFEDACRPFNAAVRRRPHVEVQVAGTGDVVNTLEAAAAHGLSVSVRGGGHGLDGAALAGDVVLDTGALHGVSVAPERRTVLVRAGCTWGAVDAATVPFGLAVPGSRVSTVGVAGLILGAGDGWLSARHGSTADHLLRAEVVTADGRRELVTGADQLRRAVAGGGVATAFTLRLHDAPPRVLAGAIDYAVADAVPVLAALAELRQVPGSDFAGVGLLIGQPGGRPGVLRILPVWLGGAREMRRGLAVLRSAARPLRDEPALTSYAALQTALDPRVPWGRRWAAGPAVAVADGAALGTALLAAGRSPAPGAFAWIGGPGPARQWLVQAGGQWRRPADDAAHRDWITALASALTARSARPVEGVRP